VKTIILGRSSRISILGFCLSFRSAAKDQVSFKPTSLRDAAVVVVGWPFTLLWGERQIRSVANMTRADARDFLKIALDLKLRPQVTAFPLDRANDALLAVKHETENGPAVILP
jgi:D-arabinose 1-dehydrogenase-like Zn-dependent alcohol dehydrogenase